MGVNSVEKKYVTQMKKYGLVLDIISLNETLIVSMCEL